MSENIGKYFEEEEEEEEEEETRGEIETAHSGYLGFQDTLYAGNLKGVGGVYQQTFVDTYSKVAFAKLSTTKTPITVVYTLNDWALLFFNSEELAILIATLSAVAALINVTTRCTASVFVLS